MTGYYCRHCGTVSRGEHSYCPNCNRDERGARQVAPVVPDVQKVLTVVPETFPYREDATENLPYHIFEMTPQEFCNSRHRVNISQQANDKGDVKTLQPQLLKVYVETYLAMAKDMKISKSKTLANSLKHGFCYWQHITHDDFKRTVNARQNLYFNNPEKLKKIFRFDHLFPQQDVGEAKKPVNVYAETTTTHAPIIEQIEYLNISMSEFVAVMLGISFMRWPKLPDWARDEILSHICMLAERQNEIVRACEDGT